MTIKGGAQGAPIVVSDDLRRIHDCGSSVETILSDQRPPLRTRHDDAPLRDDMRDLEAPSRGKNLVMANQVGGNTRSCTTARRGHQPPRRAACLMYEELRGGPRGASIRGGAGRAGGRFHRRATARVWFTRPRCAVFATSIEERLHQGRRGLSGGRLGGDGLPGRGGAGPHRTCVRCSCRRTFRDDHSVEDARWWPGARHRIQRHSDQRDLYQRSRYAQARDGRHGVRTRRRENIQTTIRTVLPMAVQNKTGYVLLNSSNKSENALGLCTLYGDTAGAFSPTGDLYKSRNVRDLARYIQPHAGRPHSWRASSCRSPRRNSVPTRSDSDILPPYEVVDAILYRMIEEGQHREEIVNAGFDSEVVEKIHSMIMRNEKKRYQFPPVLRLSTCAFGHERLMPLTNRYGD